MKNLMKFILLVVIILYLTLPILSIYIDNNFINILVIIVLSVLINQVIFKDYRNKSIKIILILSFYLISFGLNFSKIFIYRNDERISNDLFIAYKCENWNYFTKDCRIPSGPFLKKENLFFCKYYNLNKVSGFKNKKIEIKDILKGEESNIIYTFNNGTQVLYSFKDNKFLLLK